MEEKERFEIHIYDDVCVDLYNNGVLDKSINDTYKLEKLLNQQDKRIKELEEERDSNYENYSICWKENTELKQQLAEKDKDIKYFKESYYMIQDEKDHYAGQCLNLQDRIEELEKIINESFHNQDKISFAVEQLEKVKNYMITDEKDMFGANYLMNSVYVLEFIDNQIKELKGEE